MMCSYCTTHPRTRHERRACRQTAQLHAGMVALYRRPAPTAHDHAQERREQRESLRTCAQRRRPAA